MGKSMKKVKMHAGSVKWLKALAAFKKKRGLSNLALAALLECSPACFQNWAHGTPVSDGMRLRAFRLTKGALKFQ
jgi:hypothetical protein